MSTMKAAVVTSGGLEFRTDYPIPQPGPGEALIKTTRLGICNTDLEILKGYMGFSGVLGHEFLGIVTSVPENDRIRQGDRVVGEINLPKLHCSCPACQTGGIDRRNHCYNRTTLGISNKDGTFAEYLTLPLENLFVVPDEISDERALFAEPLAAAFRIVEQGLVKKGDKIAVIGDGKLGLLSAMVMEDVYGGSGLESGALKSGESNPETSKSGTSKSSSPTSNQTQSNVSLSNITLFGKHPEKMALESNKSHTTVVVDDTTAEKFQDAFDVCVEASGSPQGIHLACALTRPLGTLVLKSTCAMGSEFNTAPFVIKEISIVGSRCGNFQMAVEALKGGKYPVENLITKVYPMGEILEAVAHAGKKGTMKIQVKVD